jgi:hypothetical protein
VPVCTIPPPPSVAAVAMQVSMKQVASLLGFCPCIGLVAHRTHVTATCVWGLTVVCIEQLGICIHAHVMHVQLVAHLAHILSCQLAHMAS